MDRSPWKLEEVDGSPWRLEEVDSGDEQYPVESRFAVRQQDPRFDRSAPTQVRFPCFSLANLVQPTRLSSTALLVAGYFISSLPPNKDCGIPMK